MGEDCLELIGFKEICLGPFVPLYFESQGLSSRAVHSHFCSLHTPLGHALHRAHDVVGRLEVLEDTVLELLLLTARKLSGVVSSLQRALTAHSHHGVDKLSVALHCDSLLIHFFTCVGPINFIISKSSLIKSFNFKCYYTQVQRI